jgi:polyphosphate glucokinase
VKRLTSALLLDDVVIGGGNAKKLKHTPTGVRLGSNAKALLGGFRMWEPWASRDPQTRQSEKNH